MDPLATCARWRTNEEDLVADNFAANLPEIRGNAEDFGNVASDIIRIQGTVKNGIPDPKLIASGDDGSNDQFTDLFASRIAPAMQGADQLLLGMHDGINNQHDLLLTTVDFYEKADNFNTEQAGNLLNHTAIP
jgi:hypothetical protein